MRDIVQTCIDPPGGLKCSVVHRLGEVPVGDPSIVIAVSSPHREEAFEACRRVLDEIKLKAQIWKREFYADEDNALWKQNEFA
jgi:molybdopterin synthase catalytic subunit